MYCEDARQNVTVRKRALYWDVYRVQTINHISTGVASDAAVTEPACLRPVLAHQMANLRCGTGLTGVD